MATNENVIERHQMKAVMEMMSTTAWMLRELQPQQLQTVNGGQMSRDELREFFEGLLQM